MEGGLKAGSGPLNNLSWYDESELTFSILHRIIIQVGSGRSTWGGALG